MRDDKAGIDYRNSDAKCLKFDMIEGEHFIGMTVSEYGNLYVGTNLNRIFVSTNTPAENIDFVEIENS